MKYKPNNIYNVDSYIAIKDIPDKSIDCVYTDVPYLFDSGGGGSSELAQRIIKINEQLSGYRKKQEETTTDEEREKNRISGNVLASQKQFIDLTVGFDYSILDEFVRVMKKVNIIIWFSKLQMQYILNYFMNLKDKEIYFEHFIKIEKAIKKAQKQEELLELYKKLITIKDEAISIVWFDADYFGTEMEEEAKDLEKQIKELEKQIKELENE